MHRGIIGIGILFLALTSTATAYTTLSGTQNGAFTMNAGQTYYVDGEWIVQNGTLTVMGGAIVKFSGNGAIVITESGRMQTNSTGTPIILTSAKDNTVGEPISGSSGTPVAGDYSVAIYYAAASYSGGGGGDCGQVGQVDPTQYTAEDTVKKQKKTTARFDQIQVTHEVCPPGGGGTWFTVPLTLNYVQIRYADVGVLLDELRGPMTMTFRNGRMQDISSQGILNSSIVTITNSVFERFGGPVVHALTLTIRHNKFLNNASSQSEPMVYMMNSGEFANNLIANASGYSTLLMAGGSGNIVNNTFANNTPNYAVRKLSSTGAFIANNVFVNNKTALNYVSPAGISNNAFFGNTADYAPAPATYFSGDLHANNGLTANPLRADFTLNNYSNGGHLLVNAGLGQSSTWGVNPYSACMNGSNLCTDAGTTDIGFHEFQMTGGACSCPDEGDYSETTGPGTDGPAGSSGGGAPGGPGGGGGPGGPSGPSSTTCGNGVCASNETEDSCPLDCKTDVPLDTVLGSLIKECKPLTNSIDPTVEPYGLNDADREKARRVSELSLITLWTTRIYNVTQGPPGHKPYHAIHTLQVRNGDTKINDLETLVPVSESELEAKQPHRPLARGVAFSFDDMDAGDTIRFSFNQPIDTIDCPILPPLLLNAAIGSRTGIVTRDRCTTDLDCTSENVCQETQCINSTCVLFQKPKNTPCAFGHSCNAQGACTPNEENAPGANPNDLTLLTAISGIVIGLGAVLIYYWSHRTGE